MLLAQCMEGDKDESFWINWTKCTGAQKVGFLCLREVNSRIQNMLGKHHDRPWGLTNNVSWTKWERREEEDLKDLAQIIAGFAEDEYCAETQRTRRHKQPRIKCSQFFLSVSVPDVASLSGAIGSCTCLNPPTLRMSFSAVYKCCQVILSPFF